MEDPEGMSETELRRVLRRLLVDTTQARTQPELVALYKKYATGPARPASTSQNGNTTSRSSSNSTPNQSTNVAPQKNTHGIYVNGKFIPPPQGISGMVNWKLLAVIVLASGVFMSKNDMLGAGGNNENRDTMGVRGHTNAYQGSGVAAFTNGNVLDVSTHNEFLGALEYHWDVTNLPVVVDFYSESCGPCRMIAPAYEALATQFKDKAVFLKVNTQKLQQTSTMLGVRALPTFMFFMKGKPVQDATFSGADAQKIAQFTNALAAKAQEEGTYVSRKFSSKDVEKFVTQFTERKEKISDEDFAKLVKDASQLLIDEHTDKPASLARALKEKYGAVPQANMEVVRVTTAEAKNFIASATAMMQDLIQAFSGSDKETSNGDENKNENENENANANVNVNVGTNVDGVIYLSLAEFAAMPRSKETQQTVIIGGGPAGLSAAIYAGRAGLQPIIISPVFGGQLLGKGVAVENYPGIIGDTPATGETVVKLMRKQAAEFDTLFLNAKLENVGIGKESSPFVLKVADTNAIDATGHGTVETRTLILATGSNSKWLGVPGEEEFKGRGVTSCATCDGHLYRGSDVTVIGGGDTACEDALVLARTSKSVTMIVRDNKLRASKILAKRVTEHASIQIKWNSAVTSFEGADQGLTHVAIKNNDDGSTEDVTAGAAFIAIGHTPNSQTVSQHLDTDDVGYVRVESHSTKTKVPGLFACGDVADKVYRQAVTSAGTGAMAALDAERYLSEQG